MAADKVSMGWNSYLKIWIASNDRHSRLGNSPEEALYMLMIAGFEAIVPKKQIA